MKQNISFYDFERAFRDFDRFDNFGYDGLKALYEYLIQYEEDCGQELELDVIALCCEFCRYEDVQDFLGNYGDDYPEKVRKKFDGINRDDYESDEEFENAVKEKIQDYTQFIDIDGTAFIIIAY